MASSPEMACGQPARSRDGDQCAMQHLEMHLERGKASKCKLVSGFRAVTSDIFWICPPPPRFVLKHFYTPGQFLPEGCSECSCWWVCWFFCVCFFFFQKLSYSLGCNIRWPSIHHCVIHEVSLRTASSLLPHNNGSHWVLGTWKMGTSVLAPALFTSFRKAA